MIDLDAARIMVRLQIAGCREVAAHNGRIFETLPPMLMDYPSGNLGHYATALAERGYQYRLLLLAPLCTRVDHIRHMVAAYHACHAAGDIGHAQALARQIGLYALGREEGGGVPALLDELAAFVDREEAGA